MDRSERIGLSIATAGHVILFGALSLGLLRTTLTIPPPAQTIDVSLADEVALESRTTVRSEEPPQVATAPEQGAMEPDASEPEPVEAPPVLAPEPAPKAIEQPKPKPREETRPKPVKATPKPTPTPKPSPKPQRASRLGRDFLKGLDADTPSPRTATAAVPGSNAPMSPIAARALNAEINQQIARFWRPPSGADADKLVTLLSVHLDRNGAVVGQIEVVGQQGITASNRSQADLHAERAVQAVMRASPFKNLPPEYYDQWKWLQPLKFDARLSQ